MIGAKVMLINKPLLNCSWTPGTSGDHGPIHYAQTKNDEGLYQKIYNDPESIERIKINFDNWQHSPELWVRRFNLDKTRKC